MMKTIPVISFACLLALAATPCSAQTAQAPSSAVAGQTNKQDAMAPFTHAEVVQFIHTAQTQAMSWKDTISSIEPSALRMDDQTSRVINDARGELLHYLDDIEKLRRDQSDAKYTGLDQETTAAADSLALVAAEFWLSNDICEFKEGVLHLADTLVDYPGGQIDAGRLMEIYKEASTTKGALFGEILHRITTLGMHTVGRVAQKPSKQ